MTAHLMAIGTCLLALAATSAGAQERVLRVCADPDSLPHSHRDGSGFENRIAAVLADALDARLETAWISMQGRIVSNTLGAQRCDVLLGVPEGFARVATTRPYYRSSYVFVQRADETPIHSLDDPQLASMRIGVPRIRHDDAATPPAFVLAQRGGVRLVGFPMEQADVAPRIVQAVARGELDAGLLWGPQAGWYVAQADPALRLTVVRVPKGYAHLPMRVSMSLAVRSSDQALRDELNAVLVWQRDKIKRILAEYHVPSL